MVHVFFLKCEYILNIHIDLFFTVHFCNRDRVVLSRSPFFIHLWNTIKSCSSAAHSNMCRNTRAYTYRTQVNINRQTYHNTCKHVKHNTCMYCVFHVRLHRTTDSTYSLRIYINRKLYGTAQRIPTLSIEYIVFAQAHKHCARAKQTHSQSQIVHPVDRITLIVTASNRRRHFNRSTNANDLNLFIFPYARSSSWLVVAVCAHCTWTRLSLRSLLLRNYLHIEMEVVQTKLCPPKTLQCPTPIYWYIVMCTYL